jgi:hypothetical protein
MEYGSGHRVEAGGGATAVPEGAVEVGWLEAGDGAGDVLPLGVGETVVDDGAGVGACVRDGDGDGDGEWVRCGCVGDGVALWAGRGCEVLWGGAGVLAPADWGTGRTYR